MKKLFILILALMLPLVSLAEVDLKIPKASTYEEFLERINNIELMYSKKFFDWKFIPSKGTLIQTQVKGKTTFLIKHPRGTVRGLLKDGMVDSFTVTMKYLGDARLMVELVGSLLPAAYFEQFDPDNELSDELDRTVYIGKDETLMLSGYRVQVSNKNDYGIPSEFIVIYLGDSL